MLLKQIMVGFGLFKEVIFAQILNARQ